MPPKQLEVPIAANGQTMERTSINKSVMVNENSGSPFLYITPQPFSTSPFPSSSARSPRYQPTLSFVRYAIPTQEVSIELITPPESRMIMGGGDRL
ncbi:hypothetical protein EVAR_74310_1 [Eumeta japonica]|uniref:Uncharacterized protein n=1 Tax=Eumeta variegata TaxID=151549 RepID=A0A4C1SFK7_EUMVA|nr:hypothetical protein EVAR_74310_1 [Eumeta japonica]